jgi:hypothetical protein
MPLLRLEALQDHGTDPVRWVALKQDEGAAGGDG